MKRLSSLSDKIVSNASYNSLILVSGWWIPSINRGCNGRCKRLIPAGILISKELKSITISDEAKKEDQEIINDLIIAAYNNAKENLKKKSAEELSKVTGGLNLPSDFKLPF